MLPTQVWIHSPPLWGTYAGWYVPVEQIGASIEAVENDWGVRVTSKPNHLLGKDHGSIGRTNTRPQYDYDDMVATIAFRGDKRLAIEVELPEAGPADGVLELSVPEAELWPV